MSKVVTALQFPKLAPVKVTAETQARQLTQQQLRADYELWEQYKDWSARWRATKKTLLNSRLSQQPGKYHFQKRAVYRKRIAWKALVIELKGPQWVAALIERTEPTVSYKLEWAEIGSQTSRNGRKVTLGR